MVIEHKVFEKPKNSNQKIWRYMDFTKFVDLLTTQSLFFCRVDLFDDTFEGSVPQLTAQLRDVQVAGLIEKGELKSHYTPEFLQKVGMGGRKNYALNCWHMNDFESAAMWKLYGKSNEGIAIQSTYNKLEECLNESELYINLGIVKYIDYAKEVIGWGNGFLPYIHKRKSFEHEKELRALIWKKTHQNEGKVDFSKGGATVPVDIRKLIEKVHVSPDSPLWFTQLVHRITEKLGFDMEVTNSSLNQSPIY